MSENEDPQPEIYVGDKSLGKYVKALKYRLSDLSEAKAVARGTHITKAIDSSQIVEREEENVSVDGVEIDTEEDENEDGETFKVSKIEIQMSGEVELETDSDQE